MVGAAQPTDWRAAALSACSSCAVRAQGICSAVRPKVHGHATSRPRQTIYRANEPLNGVRMICEGWAFSFTLLPDGRRHIISFLLPGDLVSVRSVLQDRLPFSVHTLTEVRHCSFERAELIAAMREKPDVFQQFSDLCVAELESANQLATDMGRRSAEQRLARLILGLKARLTSRNLVRDQSFEFPLRQQHMADAISVTSVHVSRMITTLHDAGVIDLRNRRLKILRQAELERIANAR